MPAILLTIRCEGAVPGAGLSEYVLKRTLQEAWYEPGRNWHEQYRPKHFTKEGEKEYGYEPRSGEPGTEGAADFWRSYTGKKQHKFGHTLPLVWSGDLMNRARTARIEAKPDGVKVFLPGANKANWHNPKSKVNMREELTRISVAEARESTRLLAETIQEKLDRVRTIQIQHYGQNASPTTSVAGFFHGD